MTIQEAERLVVEAAREWARHPLHSRAEHAASVSLDVAVEALDAARSVESREKGEDVPMTREHMDHETRKLYDAMRAERLRLSLVIDGLLIRLAALEAKESRREQDAKELCAAMDAQVERERWSPPATQAGEGESAEERARRIAGRTLQAGVLDLADMRILQGEITVAIRAAESAARAEERKRTIEEIIGLALLQDPHECSSCDLSDEERRTSFVLTMAEETGIEPCPWCGSVAECDERVVHAWVECSSYEKCGATGPSLIGAPAAIAAWNKVAHMPAEIERLRAWLSWIGKVAREHAGMAYIDDGGCGWARISSYCGEAIEGEDAPNDSVAALATTSQGEGPDLEC